MCAFLQIVFKATLSNFRGNQPTKRSINCRIPISMPTPASVIRGATIYLYTKARRAFTGFSTTRQRSEITGEIPRGMPSPSSRNAKSRPLSEDGSSNRIFMIFAFPFPLKLYALTMSFCDVMSVLSRRQYNQSHTILRTDVMTLCAKLLLNTLTAVE